MNYFLVFLTIFILCSGCAQEQSAQEEVSEATPPPAELSEVEQYFQAHVQDSLPGISRGAVHSGSLVNGTVVPFAGENFIYFDTSSYLAGRAHTRPDVSASIQEAYAAMKTLSDHRFVLMELSLPEGGEIMPHRTHQNGLSADFMTPLLRKNVRFTDLDLEGAPHYLLDFDAQGRWTEDAEVHIDFDLVAAHLLALQKAAKKHKLKIQKVIWKMELRDELYTTPNGKELAKSGIYITQNLTPLINRLHDDHYHVDFEVIP
jgi:penicillin-insensitive murein endopeptidase